MPGTRELTIIVAAAVLALSACGQRGPLVLPGAAGQTKSEPPAKPAPADKR
ncbi:MAG: lipoprotein [Burkholderiaceae bacterium]